MIRAVLLAAALASMPFDARAADLVVWWEKGYNPDEDRTVRELVTAFEQRTGKQVDLTFHTIGELPGRTSAAVEAGRPPDLVYGTDVAYIDFPRWAHEGRLADLADVLGPLAAQFDRDALDHVTLPNATAGRRGLYALPMGRITPARTKLPK